MGDAMDHDFFWLFNRYWWLIFPIFGMAMGVMAMWQRHARANRTIDLIKSYADQGKEPPPELLAALRDPDFLGRRKPNPSWVGVFLFAALTAGMLMFALMTGDGAPRHMAPFLFAALVMGGICLGQLVNVLTQQRDRNPPQ
jgi:hypothetical protein